MGSRIRSLGVARNTRHSVAPTRTRDLRLGLESTLQHSTCSHVNKNWVPARTFPIFRLPGPNPTRFTGQVG